MTPKSKAIIIGATVFGAAAAAYYFLFYQQAQTQASSAVSNVVQSAQSIVTQASSPTAGLEGKVVRIGTDPKVYLIKNGQKQWITTPDALTRAGFGFADVLSLTAGQVNAIPSGPNLNGLGSLAQKLIY